MEIKRYLYRGKIQQILSNQVFLDTIQYFQQSLANSLTDEEKKSIQKECIKFISKDESLLRKFKKYTEQDQE